MDAVIAQHEQPKPGAAALEMGELHVPGFASQLATNLRRNFIIYNRAPGGPCCLHFCLNEFRTAAPAATSAECSMTPAARLSEPLNAARLSVAPAPLPLRTLHHLHPLHATP